VNTLLYTRPCIIRKTLVPIFIRLPFSVDFTFNSLAQLRHGRRILAQKLHDPQAETLVQPSAALETKVTTVVVVAPKGNHVSPQRGSKLDALRARLLVVFPFQVVLTMIVLAVPFLLARQGMNDPDIWWHLRNAEYLIQHQRMPDHDMYSFTVPANPWINHEWLSEIPYYFAWKAFGLVGVKSLSLVLLGCIFLGILYLSYRESLNFKASVTACCFSVFLCSVSFGPRTILFGYIYLIGLLIILQHFRQVGKAPLWLIPPLFCLWANTHGSWLLGLIIFSIIAAAGLVSGRWGIVEAKRWSAVQFRKLASAWVATIVALFINPFGWRLVAYPFDLAFRQKLNIAHVAEWVSVDFHTMRGKMVMGLLIVLLINALVRRSRWRLAELLVFLFALYSGLTYTRFLVLLAIAAAPILAKALDFFSGYRPEMETPIFNAVVVMAIVAGMVHYWPKEIDLQRSVAENYPSKVMPFLQTHPPAGPMLNFYLWGGYLGWNNKDVKVFVDSRVDIFEYAGVLQDYLDLLALKHLEAVLQKHKIQYVLFPPNEPLTHVLQMDPQWKTIYQDDLAVLLERASESERLERIDMERRAALSGRLERAD